MADFYHLCFVVPDIDRATADLTNTVGISWQRVRDGRLGQWDFSIVFSADGPPFFEVITGPAGSPWDAADGARFDHLGYWTTDLSTHQRDMVDAGAPLEFDACPLGRAFTYHRIDSIGSRIELVDVTLQPGFVASWNADGADMNVLDPAATD